MGRNPTPWKGEFQDVAAVVDGIDERVHVFGHSYGGICALESTLLTGHIDRLVLYEPPMKADPTRVLSIRVSSPTCRPSWPPGTGRVY